MNALTRRHDASLTEMDYVLIRQLLARSAHALDSADAEGWAAAFLPEGQLRLTDPAWSGPSSYQQRAELRAYAAHLAALPEATSTRRWLNLPVIEGSGNTARVRTYQMQYTADVGRGAGAVASSIVEATVYKDGNDWLYSRYHLVTANFAHEEWARGAKAGLAGCGSLAPYTALTPSPAQQPPSSSAALDYELILQTLSSFLFFMDSGTDSSGLANLFTEDGLWHMFGVDRLYRSGSWHGTPMEPVYRGRAAIEEFNRTAHRNRGPWDRHWAHMPVIRISGDEATATFPYATILAGTGKDIQQMTSGVFRDKLRKVDGSWLIKECAAHIERAPSDPDDVYAAAAGHYVGDIDWGVDSPTHAVETP
ncbi:nuclear transport factor 2 family protein [Streptomyces sp. NPDC054919]